MIRAIGKVPARQSRRLIAGAALAALCAIAPKAGAGHIKCEVRGEDGRAIPGFALADAKEVFGDEIELAMEWKGGADLSSLAGRPVSLHFEMKDADIYSYVFR